MVRNVAGQWSDYQGYLLKVLGIKGYKEGYEDMFRAAAEGTAVKLQVRATVTRTVEYVRNVKAAAGATAVTATSMFRT